MIWTPAFAGESGLWGGASLAASLANTHGEP